MIVILFLFIIILNQIDIITDDNPHIFISYLAFPYTVNVQNLKRSQFFQTNDKRRDLIIFYREIPCRLSLFPSNNHRDIAYVVRDLTRRNYHDSEIPFLLENLLRILRRKLFSNSIYRVDIPDYST